MRMHVQHRVIPSQQPCEGLCQVLQREKPEGPVSGVGV